MKMGIGVSPGIGIGPALRYFPAVPRIPDGTPQDSGAEWERLLAALERTKQSNAALCQATLERAGESEAEIFEAYNEILEDEDTVLTPIRGKIEAGRNAEQAADQVFEELAQLMASLEDEHLGARASDFRDLKHTLLCELLGLRQQDLSHLTERVVLVAAALSPADTAKLDLTQVAGILCEEGGPTSHTAILARALGIPAVVGCKGLLDRVADGEELCIDGSTGEVLLSPDGRQRADFSQRAARYAEKQEALQVYVNRPSVSADGHYVRFCANIADAEEAAAAVCHGCEGIGLFRSEFLYLHSDSLPSEATQLAAYRQALQGAQGRPVTIRTLDVGGDKHLPCLQLEPEDNPFLGYRAIRICLDRREIFRIQLRAILRASAEGRARILFPMISSIEELRAAKALVEEVKAELRQEGIAFDEQIAVGMMVEVPTAAVLADFFAQEVDFFSIGTNDLVQYVTAVDRGNPKVQALYSHFHPAILRLLRYSIESAHRSGIHCCVCGEAASDPAFLPVLLGLGLDEFSVSPSMIPTLRAQLSRTSYKECRELCGRLEGARTAVEARLLAETMTARGDF